MHEIRGQVKARHRLLFAQYSRFSVNHKDYVNYIILLMMFKKLFSFQNYTKAI